MTTNESGFRTCISLFDGSNIAVVCKCLQPHHKTLIRTPPVGGGRYQYLELARNYRHVAETMLQSAIEKDEVNDWAYPVLFAYRHTLELYLKLIGEIDEITHSLKTCAELVEKRHGIGLPSPIREWILELEGIDPGGTAFRYADEDSTLNQHYEQWFDFRHFQFAMKHVFDAIDDAILRVDPKGKPAKKKKKKKR